MSNRLAPAAALPLPFNATRRVYAEADADETGIAAQLPRRGAAFNAEEGGRPSILRLFAFSVEPRR